MNRFSRAALAAALCLPLLSAPLFAHEFKAGALDIHHPMIPLPPKAAKSAAGYMTITNAGTEPDALIAIETPFAKKSDLHTTEMSGPVASMKEVPRLEIPAGATVTMESGGYHIMMMGLTETLEQGTKHPATLVFEKAGRVPVEFSVDPAEAMDHSNHGG